MSHLPRRSGTTDTTTGTDQIGTIRRFDHSIAIILVHESDGGRVFRLATLPNAGGLLLAEIVCHRGQASPLWEVEDAASIGLLSGSLFAKGLIRTVQAIDAARDGTPIDCEDHGLRRNPRTRFFLPTMQEADA